MSLKPPKNPGPAAWNELLPPPPEPNVLDAAITADWLVIGGGWAGLAAARRLSQLRGGDKIVLLEAGRIGEGPAGRNSGFMVDLPHDLASDNYAGDLSADKKQIAMNRAAIDFAQEAARDYELPDEAFARIGKMNAAATEAGLKHNEDFAKHLRKLGEPFERYDAAKMREITGGEYYVGGLYTPGAAIAQPAMYVRGVAEGLSRKVQIYEGSPVTALNRDAAGESAGWRADTPQGSVRAGAVILAVNGMLERFGYLRGRLMHVFTYASMTRELTDAEIKRLGGLRRWGCTPSDPMGTSVRRISGVGGDRVVIRNRFTFDPKMEVSDGRLRRVARDHDRAFAARFPRLAGVEMAFRWGGRLCLSYNGVPAFGELEPRLYSACCQNGLGTVKGTLSGIAAADLAAKGNSPLVADMLASGAPSKLPPEPLAWIGANVYLRFKEWRAGAEL